MNKIINFSTNQKIDALNFNASDYENLINNNDDFRFSKTWQEKQKGE